MWPFGRKTPQKPAVYVPDEDERLRAVERDMKDMKLEWSETYESIERMVRKLAKRDKREASLLDGGKDGDQPAVASPAPFSKDDLRRWARANGHLP